MSRSPIPFIPVLMVLLALTASARGDDPGAQAGADAPAQADAQAGADQEAGDAAGAQAQAPQPDPIPRGPYTVSCEVNPSGYVQMRNSFGTWIGAVTGWRQTDADACRSLLRNSLNGDLLCSWNGKKYQYYNPRTGTGVGVHSAEHGYGDDAAGKDTCARNAKAQPPTGSYVCAWNGKYYSPHHRETNVLLSGAQQGWESASDCARDALKDSTELGVCTWHGHHTIYLADGTPSGETLRNWDQCYGYQRLFLRRMPSLERAKEFFRSLKAERTELPSAFREGRPSEEVGFTNWKECGVRDHAWHLTKSSGGYLVRECSPDTLYAWGDAAKLVWWVENLRDGARWPGKLPRTLFTTSSAAGTFGYGYFPMRFKIKPGVRYRLRVNPTGYRCEDFVSDGTLREQDFANTIIARMVTRDGGLSFLEFNICSTDVIESWSWGTEEAFDEVLRDQAWMRSKHYFEWEAYSKRNGVDDFLDNNIDAEGYGTRFTLQALISRTGYNRVLAEFGLGSVNFPAGAALEPESHFRTAIPIYFNPE